MNKPKRTPKAKPTLHANNKHKGRYDFKVLTEANPDLTQFLQPNPAGDQSIDFSNPVAVKALNAALLKHHYGVTDWTVPEGYLCPPIPGRAEYIHHAADLLRASNFGRLPDGKDVLALDIGTGSSCIYSLIGSVDYGWSFISTEIDNTSIDNATKIVQANPELAKRIDLRFQPNRKDVLYGAIAKDDRIDITICNPPFHSSAEEAAKGSLRKVKNLHGKKIKEPQLNFGGHSNELWCDGGEKRFVHDLIRESKKFTETCYWFTTLISKETHVKIVIQALKVAKATEIKTIPMGVGNKSSRIIAWTFLTEEQRHQWQASRWSENKGKILKG